MTIAEILEGLALTTTMSPGATGAGGHKVPQVKHRRLSSLIEALLAEITGIDVHADGASRAVNMVTHGMKKSRRRLSTIDAGAHQGDDGPEPPRSTKAPVKKVRTTAKITDWRQTSRGMMGITVASRNNPRETST